ncbi:MAG: D-Ala-D-Ala carboxypeptidase family metallohydrolase [Eubacterium sp.]
MSNERVELGQEHSNNFVENKITVDGIPGHDTKAQGIRIVQHAMNLDYSAGLAEDGAWGANSDIAFGGHTVKEGETQYMVTALEILLLLNGYDPSGVECPGVFGSGLGNAVEQYQSDNGLNIDRIAGKEVFYNLMNVESVQEQPVDTSNLANFGPDEFKCECGCGGDIKPELKALIQKLRDYLGDPVTITSGYRCHAQNASVGGVSDSLHMDGDACDLYCSGHGVGEVADAALAVGMPGVIRYYGSKFVHVQLWPRDSVGD